MRRHRVEQDPPLEVRRHLCEPSSFVGTLGGKLVHVGSLEDVACVNRRQRVHLVVGSQGEKPSDSVQLQIFEGVFRQDVIAFRFEPILTSLGHVLPIGVHQRHLHTFGLQCLRHRTNPATRTEQQHSLGVRCRHTKPPCDTPRSEPVEGHGSHDDEEHDRSELLGPGIAQLHQFQREDRRYRGGDDSPRRHETQEDPLAPCEKRADGGQGDRRGPHHEYQHRKEPQTAGIRVRRIADGEPRGEDDEKRRDEQHAEVLFELDDVPYRDDVLAGQGTPHHRHREQPRLRQDEVRQREDHHHDRQRHGALQEIGHPVALEEQHDQTGAGQPQRTPGAQRLHHTQDGG